MTHITRSARPSSAGFSLVELMVSITIATTLATIAIPSYIQQIRQSRHMEARAAVLELAAREERFFSTNSAYTTAPAKLGYSGEFPQVTGSGYYQLSVCVAAALPCGTGNATSGNAYFITATPVGSQKADTQCTAFSLDSTGVQSATGTTAATCWIR